MVNGKMAAIIEGLVSALMELVGMLASLIGEIAEGLLKGIIEVAKLLGEVILSAGKALFSGFESAVSSLWDFFSNLSTPSMPSVSLDFVSNAFGRKTDVNIFQWDAAGLLKDQAVSFTMQTLRVAQPQQSLATVLYVGGKAGVKAGCKKYEQTGNLNKSIEVARREAAVKVTGQVIREIPNFVEAGSPAVNYVEGKICDKAADEAEHELRRELSGRRV